MQIHFRANLVLLCSGLLVPTFANPAPPKNCQSITTVLMKDKTSEYFLFTDVPAGAEYVSYEFHVHYPGEPWQNCTEATKAYLERGRAAVGPPCSDVFFSGTFTPDMTDKARHFVIRLTSAASGLDFQKYVRLVVNYTTNADVCSSQMSYEVTGGTNFQQLTDIDVPDGKKIAQAQVFARTNPAGPWKPCQGPPVPTEALTNHHCGDPDVGMSIVNSHPPGDKSTGVNTYCGANPGTSADGRFWCRIRLDYAP